MRELMPTYNDSNPVRSPIHVGISPVRWLPPKCNQDKEVSLLIEDGI
jgi:hypothetical protein